MLDLSESTDEELMSAYVAGDAAAHRALFERLAPLVLGLARRHLRDEGEAEDVVQRVFLSIHRARHDFRPGAKLRPWAITIAMNVIRDSFRRRSRRRESPLDEETRTLVAPAERDPVEREEQAKRVRHALEQLPVDQRRAIELHWLEERSFAEVARMLGASVTAVKVRAHRGYKRMRGLLSPSEPKASHFLETDERSERTQQDTR